MNEHAVGIQYVPLCLYAPKDVADELKLAQRYERLRRERLECAMYYTFVEFNRYCKRNRGSR